MSSIIYLDNHSTTQVDPRVVESMLPVFHTHYGNSGSVTHELGMDAHDLVHQSATLIAELIGGTAEEIVFTSGATESNNLAIHGVCHQDQRRRKIITAQTEHKAVLDPIERICHHSNFESIRLPVGEWGTGEAGLISLSSLESAIDDQTALVSIMLGNNEIGTLQPIKKIAEFCRRHGVILHCDATQSVGRLPVDVDALDVDLLSFSAHKIYGPKGIGALYVRKRDRRIRLRSQIDGGGQQSGLRSGTLNVPGIVGMATALKLCVDELCGQTVAPQSTAQCSAKDGDSLSQGASGKTLSAEGVQDEGRFTDDDGAESSADQSSDGAQRLLEPQRVRSLRDLLYRRMADQLGELPINGQPLGDPQTRLYCNLNCQFPGVNAHSLMTMVDTVAVSTGSACTAAAPEPSHVLRSLGLIDDQIHSSLRFGIGRFNTRSQMIESADRIVAAVKKLRDMV